MQQTRRRRFWLLASALLVAAVAALPAQRGSTAGEQAGASEAARLLQAAINTQTVDGKLDEAIAMYQRLVKTYPSERAVVATAFVRMAQCHEQLGRRTAEGLYERVLREFPDQRDAATLARARLAAIGSAKPNAAAAPPNGAVLRQLWTEDLGIDLGEISPDGSRVGGVDGETGDLVVVDVATRKVTRLTNIPKERRWRDFADSPVWSRDGRWLAYGWNVEPSTALRVTEVNSRVSRTIALPTPMRFDWPLDWSPDGNAVLGVVRKGPGTDQSLGWITLSDGSFTELAATRRSLIVSASVSNVHGQVAYARHGYSSASEIALIPGAGRPPVTLWEGPSDYNVIGWTPGGGGLLLLDGKYGSERLSCLSVRDGAAVGKPVLLRDLPGLSPAGLTETGTLLYSVRTPSRSDIYVAPYDLSATKVGADRRRVSALPTTQHTSPSWSADGHFLAWITRTQHRPVGTGMPENSVTVLSLDRGTQRSLTLSISLAEFRNLSWLPDGRRVLAASWDAQRAHALCVIDTTSGDVEQLVPYSVFPRPTPEASPAAVLGGWSPDGHIVYKMTTAQDPDRFPRTAQLIEHTVTGGSERPVWTNDGDAYAAYPRLSPDGKWLALQVTHRAGARRWTAIGVVPADGHVMRELPVFADQQFQFHAWSPDSRGLIVTTLGPAGAARDAVYCPLDGLSPPRSIGLAARGLGETTVSPDGTHIAYSVAQAGRYEGVWTLDHFLPAASRER